MYSASLLSDTGHLKRVQEFAKNYPDLAAQSAKQNIVPFVDRRVTQLLRKAAPPPRNGKMVRWTSPKQQRAFFATNGFGEGIPYKRKSPGIEDRWMVTTTAHSGGLSITVTNESPAAPFVYGRWQQGFHADLGWPFAPPILADIAEKTMPVLVDDQLLLARSVGAERRY